VSGDRKDMIAVAAFMLSYEIGHAQVALSSLNAILSLIMVVSCKA
jgi:hypothetical protein